jgi:aldose 1-epimerase
MRIIRQTFGTLPDGTPIDSFVLAHPAGLEARVMSYGGTLISLRAPDRYGALADVVLGFDSLAPYLAGHPYFGSLIGRYGNRIAGGWFQLRGTTYHLARNDGPNHLHGGWKGFDKVVWNAHPKTAPGEVAVELGYLSHHGEEGYPGHLDVTVVYTLTDRGELRIDYTATTDRPTVVNLTQHAYFNLAGSGVILDHVLRLDAERFLPVDRGLIPTGRPRSVRGTPMDFTRPTPIGARIDADDEQLGFAHGGYDHTWVLDRERAGGPPSPAAEVYEPGSGRVLTVATTQPGIQFYSGNFLDGSLRGKGGQVYGKHHGFCLEPQHFPNSPNEPDFPSTVLLPGDTYRHTTTYGFGVRR